MSLFDDLVAEGLRKIHVPRRTPTPAPMTEAERRAAQRLAWDTRRAEYEAYLRRCGCDRQPVLPKAKGGDE